MIDPLISVIIVNWNGKKWIKRNLDSLFSQTYKNIEVIFVDNNSSDDSVEYVNNKYPKAKIIESKKNLGFSAGNNLGINKSKGNFILLINIDTWVKKNFVSELYKSYLKNKVDVIGPLETSYDKSRHKQKNYSYMIDPLGYPVLKIGSDDKTFYLKGSCLLFSRELYEESRGMDSNFFMYFEEVDWFWRLHLLNKKILQDNKLIVHHAGVGMQIHDFNYELFLWRNQNNLQMLLKNYSLRLLLVIIPIYLLMNIFEFLVLIILLKPKVAYSYIEGISFNVRNFDKIRRQRKWIQKNRLIADVEIIKKMYFGSGKLSQLLNHE